MAVHNADIARAFDEVADLLELDEANPFRVRAYRNAARTLRGLGNEVTAMLRRKEDLAELPGIGKDLAGKIREFAETGHLPLLDELHHSIPAVATELLKLPGLGPKRVKTLYQDLGIHTLEQLHRALLDGRVRKLPGFGTVIEKGLLQALETRPKGAERVKLATAEAYVRPLVEYLQRAPGIRTVTVAGSYRRGQETVGDIDILAIAAKHQPVIDWFTHYEEVGKVAAAGPTRATVILRSGLQVDLRVVGAESYGAALLYFTGSKAHNIALRAIAQKKRLKINEYGVFRGEKRLAGKTEEEVYRSVGLPYIEPELRENRGELDAAMRHRLPKLVELGDLKGDLHTHTTATDGHNSLREMAEAARERGLAYIAVTEHSRHLTVAHGLDPERLRRQIDEIDRLNEEGLGVTLLKGIEVDILEDGALDLPASVLARLDLVVGAVHSRFSLSREKQTERILRAFEQPHFSILAHPSGRLIGEREPYDVDMPRVIQAAKERGCFIELNAHPERLDLIDTHCRLAKEAGVLVSIATDAHRVQELGYLRFGVGQARRGWLEKGDVLNTRPLKELRSLLAPTMARRIS
jgi:DNA polymerase (family X)